jgi:hypothetical protein
MSGRRLFYLAFLVFLAGAILLIVGASVTTPTIIGLVYWFIAVVLFMTWFVRAAKMTD